MNVLLRLTERHSPCGARELEKYLIPRRELPVLPVAHGIVIAQLLLDVVVLCAEFANVALDISLAMAA